VPSLVDAAGAFHRRGHWLLRSAGGRLEPAEVAAELRAQVERALATGLPFSHLDSHHHVHLFAPVTAAVARLARHHGLPAVRLSDERPLWRASPAIARLLRVRPLGGGWLRHWLLTLASRRAARTLAGLVRADYVAGLPLIGPGLEIAGLARLVAALPAGTTELMCHPGFGDAALDALDPGATAREREVALLTDPILPTLLREAGVDLLRVVDLVPPRGTPAASIVLSSGTRTT
jgi:predicted glycoside hydrolase/deacetylase ChbG (UPF0249 family)